MGKETFTVQAKVKQATALKWEIGFQALGLELYSNQSGSLDDLPHIPGDAVVPIPEGYKGLYFQGIEYATTVVVQGLPGSGLSGVGPHSTPNLAAAGRIQRNARRHADAVGELREQHSTALDLHSFYYGCALQAANGAASNSTACNVDVTGYRGPDNSISGAEQIASMQSQYSPLTDVGVQQPSFVRLESTFTALSFVIITFSLPGGESALQPLAAILLDDFEYTLHYRVSSQFTSITMDWVHRRQSIFRHSV